MNAAVLTNNSCPNSKAFNCPLLAAKEEFAKRGVKLRFLFNHKIEYGEIPAADVLMINSNIFRPFWREREDLVLGFLEAAKSAGRRLVWFDTTDSTWCTQFKALPLVDVFLKSQILNNINNYLTPTRTGRVFTDYFDELYSAGEGEYHTPTPDAEHLRKLDISWNTCFENYTEDRYGFNAKLKQKLRPLTANAFGGALRVPFHPAAAERNGISCRVGLGHDRPSVVAHRQAIIDLLKENRGVDCGKVPLDGYFRELRGSRIGVGPFGVGEITLRDFEIIICGAILLKPDMSHLRTWPELFKADETMISHRWDLSDFNEKIDWILSHPARSAEIAANAQAVYRQALSPEGMSHFAERLLKKTGI